MGILFISCPVLYVLYSKKGTFMNCAFLKLSVGTLLAVVFSLVRSEVFAKEDASSTAIVVPESAGAKTSQFKYICKMIKEDDSELEGFISGKKLNTSISKGKSIALLTVFCQLDSDKSDGDQAKMNLSMSSTLPNCGKETKSLCVVSSVTEDYGVVVGESLEETKMYFLVMNPGTNIETLKDSQFSLGVKSVSDSLTIAGGEFISFGSIELGQEQVETTCRVSVTGVSEDIEEAHCEVQDCIAKNSVIVENGKLNFGVKVLGDSGELSTPKEIVWSADKGSGPDISGNWAAAPVQSPVQVQAKVTLKNGNINYCTVKFEQKGKGYTIGLNKFGDCPYYRSIRNYYYLDAQDKNPQIGGYSEPLTILGFNAQYGRRAPEIPFRGVANIAENTLSKSISISSGQVVMPPIHQRDFSKAVVVAKILGRDGSIGEPIFWGELNPTDYSLVKMNAITKEPVNENTLLVFQSFLAAKQMSGVRDIRGTNSGSIPYYVFTDSVGGADPYDRLVPFMNDSCTPVFQISLPARKDKVKNAEMRDTASCAFSRPFKFGDFKTGRVRLSIMHMTPTKANHEYPLDILKTMTAPLATSGSGASASGSGAQKACWKLPPFNFHDPSNIFCTWCPNEDWATGSVSSSTPQTETVVERTPGNECSLSLVQKTVGGSGSSGDGSGRMGIRWSTSATAWGRGFLKQIKTQGAGTILQDDVVSSSSSYSGVAAYVNKEMFNGYLSKDDANLVQRKTFVIRNWGYDTGDINAIGNNDELLGKFQADVCPGSQFNYNNVSLSWSPLILDLEGKGIKISRKAESSRAFKIRSPASEESFVDWPENVSEVAILSLPDKKGEVKSIVELFGDDQHENGFEKLKTLDSNKDGKIDKSDPIYAQLRLWMDLNRNGVAERSELFSLSDKGVISIDLQYSRSGASGTAEEKVLSGTYFNSKKGKLMNIEDVYFYEYQNAQRVNQQGK